MRKLIYIFAAASLAFSCSDRENSKDGGSDTSDGVVFSASVTDRTDGSLTRAGAYEFFGTGYEIDVYIETSYITSTQDYVYKYKGDGLFTSESPFYFSLDDSYITDLKAIWPRQSVRDEGLVTDQRELDNFRLADWLTAEATSVNIMPTDAAVPLNFERENVLVVFEIAGQNTEGIDIQELLIEIEVGTTPTAFWAYCGDDDGKAQILLDTTTSLSSTEGYLIGRMKVTDNSEYTIIFPAVDIQLEAGKRYLVTLVSQGYDVDTFVYIGGWDQDDSGGIGIPFAAPDPLDNGSFLITEPMQLVTMSYLIRHYPHPDTFVWTTSTYVISDDLVMTEEFADLYVPLPAGIFNGSIQDQNGTEITSIEYGDGQVLQLYE